MPKFQTLHIFYNPIEAEIFKGRLESEGIKTFLLDQNISYAQIPSSIGGQRLQVDSKSFIRAKQILEKYLENED